MLNLKVTSCLPAAALLPSIIVIKKRKEHIAVGSYVNCSKIALANECLSCRVGNIIDANRIHRNIVGPITKAPYTENLKIITI